MKTEGFIFHLYAGEDEGYTLGRAWNQRGGPDRKPVEIDIVRRDDRDMLKSKGAYSGFLRAALEGKIQGIIGGPNCRSRSVLRNYPVPGDPFCPRPVRRWGGEEFGITEATSKEQEEFRKDDILLWRMFYFYMISTYMAQALQKKEEVAFSLEQPASPRQYKPQTVSFWDAKEWALIKREFQFSEIHLNQGDFGGKVTKPTTFGWTWTPTSKKEKEDQRQ